MEADAEEEARADAELAADPMIDGAKTGGPSSSASTIRFRKAVSIRPQCNPTDRSVIVPAGERIPKLGGGSDTIGQEVTSRGHQIETEEAKSGIKPSFVDVYIKGHKGLDPENPEVLCDEQATEKLAKYKENVIQRHGPEFDWRAAAPDVEAIYHAGGGLPYGRWGLGDGALEYDRIPRPQRTSQGSSSRRPSRAQQEAQQEETRRLQEETRRLRENNDYMMTYLAVPPNYFSTPTGQGSPLGDAQGSQAPPNQITPSSQGSQPQQWIYPTQGPPFGDASQPPPQWVYPGQPMMMYRGQQPMFYPASQPPYYMPWRSTAPLMTPLGSTSRAPSQNPEDVDAFINQTGGTG
ncbi:hypothetical protein U9M48_039382, partial [Paspalum notatum var. saurae]